MTSPALNVEASVGARMVAVGRLPALMLSGAEIVEFTPSDTVSRTVYGPAMLYVCVGLANTDAVLSPKFHEYVSGCPSGSDEPALEKLTVSGTGPDDGVAEACAT